MDYLAKKQMI